MRQSGRGIAGVADEQALQPLDRIAQLVFFNVKINNFQQRRAAPVRRNIGGQILLVQHNSGIQLAHTPQHITVKIGRPGCKHWIGNSLSQLHQIRGTVQGTVKSSFTKVHRSQHIMLLPVPLRRQFRVR